MVDVAETRCLIYLHDLLSTEYTEPQPAEVMTDTLMKLHLAERDPQHHARPKRGVDRNNMKLRILLSYHYYKDTDLDALFEKYFTQPYPEVFADSGAFSAASKGAEINIADYAAWVKRWAHLFTTYANLDVIGDPDATDRNQKALEDWGLEPLPVFHTGSDMAHLEKLVERYQYIALGGMVPFMRFPKRIMPWLIKCFKMAQGRAVFHGFGATSWTVVKALPWYSVDSSSWGSGFRYGQVPVFDVRVGKFQTLNLGNVAAWQRHSRLVEALGFDWRDFADRKRNDRAKICAISALSYIMAEQWLRKRHGEIFIPGGQSAPGRRAHLADTSNGINYGDVDKGLKLHLADSRPFSGGDLAAAESGVKVHQSASVPSQQTEWRSWSATQFGPRIHLAEHSLDRGGVGDTSGAMEILSEGNRNR